MSNFRERLILKLCRTFTNEETEFILDQVESVLMDYDLREKETGLAPSNNADILKQFFEAKIVEGVSKTSLKTYRSEIGDFCRNVDKPLVLVETEDIRDYLLKIKVERNIGDRSLDHRRLVVNNLFNWMKDNGYITKNPCAQVHKIKFRKNKRKPLSTRELAKVRYACRNDVRETALIEFMYSTGCRVSEVSKCKLADIDFNEGEVSVIGKGNKERTVFLNDTAKEAIQRYLAARKHESMYLFDHIRGGGDQPVSTDAIRTTVRHIGERAKLNRKLQPHIMRHTTATHFIRRGMPIEFVQYYLGHTNMDTTKIYIELDSAQLKQCYLKCCA